MDPDNPLFSGRIALIGKLTVFNTPEQRVANLLQEYREAGYHEVKFDGSGLASGVYFYRLQARHTDSGQAGTYEQTRKLLLLR